MCNENKLVITSKQSIYYIDNYELSAEFLNKNNLISIGYGGGGYMDVNRPWVIRFKDMDYNKKRFTPAEFEKLFDKFVK